MGAGGRNWPGLLILGADLVGFVLMLNLSFWMRFDVFVPFVSWPLAGAAMVTLLAMYVANIYSTDIDDSVRRIALRTVAAIAVSGLIIAGLTYVIGVVRLRAEPLFWRSVLPFGLAGFALWAVTWRYVVFGVLRQQDQKRRWLLIGQGDRAQRITTDFSAASINGQLQPVMESNVMDKLFGSEQHDVANGANDWSGVVLATEAPLDDDQVAELMQARMRGVRVYDFVDFYEKYWRKIPIGELQDDWFLHSSGFRLVHHALALNAKRLLDILLSLAILIFTAPIMLLAIGLIKLDSKGPVFYTQVRTGQRSKTIRMVKFRTMVENAEQQGAAWAQVNDNRITRVGRWLRAWHLDELPQAWNVLKGDMSCIGPRPERPEFTQELEKSIPYYDLRYLVKPGITGWAQVMHPYGSSIEDARNKLEYDLYYIKNYSLLLDAFITLKTLRVMIFGGGR